MMSGDYGNTGIGTVEKYGFKPIAEGKSEIEQVDQFVDPEMFLGRTLNNLFGARHVKKEIYGFDKFVFVAQDQVSLNPGDYPSTDIVVYVHDIFPVTTVYNKNLTKNGWMNTIGSFLLNFTHMRSSRYINNANKVIAPCRTVANELEKRTALENVEYAYQGIDHLPEKKYEGSRDIDLLYFGDLVHERKNPEKVYEAFKEANKRGYTTAYMNHTDDERIEADHKFIDVPVEKLAEVLSRTRFLFQPSYAEGFGRTPLEAQKYGCIPVVLEGTQYFDVAKEVLGSRDKDEWKSFRNLEDLWSIMDLSIPDRNFENPEDYTWKRFREQMEEEL